jgi:hypothetical protein
MLQNVLDQETKLLRLEIDGRWGAAEFGGMLSSIADLYNLRLYMELRAGFMTRSGPRHPQFLATERDLQSWSVLVGPRERLIVRRLRFESPGITDLIGIGKIVESIRKFIQFLIERNDNALGRELDEERKSLKNDAMLLENIKQFIEIQKMLGSEVDPRGPIRLVGKRQRILKKEIDAGKIESVSIEDSDE